MKITRHLNLVMELSRGEGTPPVIVHSTALPNDIFEQYFDLCGPTFNALLHGGYGDVAPRYAALLFKRIAMANVGAEPAVPTEAWRRAHQAAEDRVKAFFSHLHALTYVMTLRAGKWGNVLLDDALAMEAIDEEEMSRIEGALCFFTCTSQSVPREIREAMLGGLSLYVARTESSGCMDFMNSLPTSMPDGSSGGSQKEEGSSRTSSPGSQGRDSSASSPAGSGHTKAHQPSAIDFLSVSRRA